MKWKEREREKLLKKNDANHNKRERERNKNKKHKTNFKITRRKATTTNSFSNVKGNENFILTTFFY